MINGSMVSSQDFYSDCIVRRSVVSIVRDWVIWMINRSIFSDPVRWLYLGLYKFIIDEWLQNTQME